MQSICTELDADNSGYLTKEELLEGATTSLEFANLLKLMDVSTKELTAVFNILDSDRSGSISHQEFVEQLHKMRNGDSRVLLMLIKHDVLCVSDELKSQMSALQTKVDQLLGTKSSNIPIQESASDPITAIPDQPSTNTKEALVGTLGGNVFGQCCAHSTRGFNDSPALTASLESIIIRVQSELDWAQRQLAMERQATSTSVACNENATNLPSMSFPLQTKVALKGYSHLPFQLAAVPSERHPPLFTSTETRSPALFEVNACVSSLCERNPTAQSTAPHKLS
jgi:hypothetical protein